MMGDKLLTRLLLMGIWVAPEVSFKASRTIDWEEILSFSTSKRLVKSSHLFIVPSMRLIQLFRPS